MSSEAVEATARVASVVWTGLLDTAPEEAFDRLTRLASVLTGAPLVFLSLLDDRRSFTKSIAGVDTLSVEQRSTPVEESFCQHVVVVDDEYVVDDVALDPTTGRIPGIQARGVAAWASFPVRDPTGTVLGAFCALDTVTRAWSDQDREVLRTLTQAASGEIALRGALRDAQIAYAEAERHAAEAERHAAASDRHAQRAEQSAAEATELAETLQQSLLPAHAPRIPGMEVAARYRPGGAGADVLGDFYDMFPIPGGWGVAIGDVAGKGAWAARTTALARSSMRAVGHTDDDAASVLASLNDVLHVWFGSHRSFVTATYVTLVAGNDGLDVVVANGGHPPAFVLRADGEVRQFNDGGRALGLLAEASVATETTVLRPGDALVLYTDGVTESRRPGCSAQFGEHGVAQALIALEPGATAEAIADAISSAALGYAGGSVPDDTAVVVVRSP